MDASGNPAPPPGSAAGGSPASGSTGAKQRMNPVVVIEECPVEDNAPLFYAPGKRGFYSPRQGMATYERINAFRNVGRYVSVWSIKMISYENVMVSASTVWSVCVSFKTNCFRCSCNATCSNTFSVARFDSTIWPSSIPSYTRVCDSWSRKHPRTKALSCQHSILTSCMSCFPNIWLILFFYIFFLCFLLELVCHRKRVAALWS